jgi:hypothetical protein
MQQVQEWEFLVSVIGGMLGEEKGQNDLRWRAWDHGTNLVALDLPNATCGAAWVYGGSCRTIFLCYVCAGGLWNLKGERVICIRKNVLTTNLSCAGLVSLCVCVCVCVCVCNSFLFWNTILHDLLS